MPRKNARTSRVFTFEYNDGNVGEVLNFDSAEGAVKAAEYMWYHLTPRERVKYTDGRYGGVFMVCDPEGRIIRDWSPEAEVSICINTPSGPRRIDLPANGDCGVWDLIIAYDEQHGTHIFDLYEPKDIDTDGEYWYLPLYDPSDEETSSPKKSSNRKSKNKAGSKSKRTNRSANRKPKTSLFKKFVKKRH